MDQFEGLESEPPDVVGGEETIETGFKNAGEAMAYFREKRNLILQAHLKRAIERE